MIQVMRESGRDPSLLRQDEQYRDVYLNLGACDHNYLWHSVSDMVDETMPRLEETPALTQS